MKRWKIPVIDLILLGRNHLQVKHSLKEPADKLTQLYTVFIQYVHGCTSVEQYYAIDLEGLKSIIVNNLTSPENEDWIAPGLSDANFLERISLWKRDLDIPPKRVNEQ